MANARPLARFEAVPGPAQGLRKKRMCCRGRTSATRSKTSGSAAASRRTWSTLILCSRLIGGIFGPVLDEDDAAAVPESANDAGQHFVRKLELVVDVNHDREIDARRGELHVVDRSKHRANPRQLVAAGQLAELADHFRLHVDGEDDTTRADYPRHAPRDEAGTRADVGDGHARRKMQLAKEQVGALFCFALGALEPWCRLPTHNLRDLSPHVGLADAVGRGGNALVDRLRALGGCGSRHRRRGEQHQQGATPVDRWWRHVRPAR